MTGRIGATMAADVVLEGADLRRRRILVTGMSAGIGVETARAAALQAGSEEPVGARFPA